MRVQTRVPDFIRFATHGDERGQLVALEGEADVPFSIRRVYYIFGTEPGVRRGLHAHRLTRQLAICVQGSCCFLLETADRRAEVTLSERNRGLLVEPMVWHEMSAFSPDCVLLMLADRKYDEDDYIRDYSTFRSLALR